MIETKRLIIREILPSEFEYYMRTIEKNDGARKDK